MKHYKTYRGRPTKREKEIKDRNKTLSIFLCFFFLCIFMDIITGNKISTEIKEVVASVPEVRITENIEIKEAEVVSLPIKVARNEDQKKVEFKIREIAHEANFKWPDYLVKLADCESKLNPNNINKNNNNPANSHDRGLFQFNSYWQPGVSDECAYNLECATKKAIEMINDGRQHLWACNQIVLGKK